MSPHPVSAATRAAYAAAHYEVDAPGGRIALRVGERNAGFDARLGAAGARGGVLITAHNPMSRVLPPGENAARHDELIALLAAAGCRHWPARGRDPGGLWPVEESSFVIDASESQIEAWLLRFEQAALLEVRRGEPSQLRWHPALAQTAQADAR